MNWKHWTEQEPEDNQWIFVYYSTDPQPFSIPSCPLPFMERIQYYKCDSARKYFLKHPDKWPGWTHWCSYDEVPRPYSSKEIR